MASAPPLNTSSLVCSCGWSKATTYQDLKTHQATYGCSPRAVEVEESHQATYGCLPRAVEVEESHQETNGCSPRAVEVEESQEQDMEEQVRSRNNRKDLKLKDFTPKKTGELSTRSVIFLLLGIGTNTSVVLLMFPCCAERNVLCHLQRFEICPIQT